MLKKEAEKVCNLEYLHQMLNGKKPLIKEMIDIILLQVPAELKSMNLAIENNDYLSIGNFAHIMQTSVSIMGVSTLSPVLRNIEDSANKKDIEKIKKEKKKLNIVCMQAFSELKVQNELINL
jgi:HPt (histidine-containing phosphotransfer) domain-containing protein